VSTGRERSRFLSINQYNSEVRDLTRMRAQNVVVGCNAVTASILKEALFFCDNKVFFSWRKAFQDTDFFRLLCSHPAGIPLLFSSAVVPSEERRVGE
jgi:hypothetical protein